MSISFSTVTTGNAGYGLSGVTASISLSASELGLIAVFSYDSGGSGPTTPTISGWNQVLQTQAQVNPNYPVGCTVFRRVGSFSGTQTITYDITQGYILWQLIKCTGSLLTGTNGADAIRQTITDTTGSGTASSISKNFTTYTPTANGNAILAFGIDWGVNTITPRTDFTALYNDPNVNLATCATMYRATGTDTAVSYTSSGTAEQGIGGIEIAAAAAAYISFDHFGTSGMFGV